MLVKRAIYLTDIYVGAQVCVSFSQHVLLPWFAIMDGRFLLSEDLTFREIQGLLK